MANTFDTRVKNKEIYEQQKQFYTENRKCYSPFTARCNPKGSII